MTIKGHLEFNNHNVVNMDNIIMEGSIDFSSNNTENNYIHFNHVQFYGRREKKGHCIHLYGQVEIENSKFYGHPLCEQAIIWYDGENHYDLKIFNSIFDGVYINPCLYVTNGILFIQKSTFERAASFGNEG